MKNLIRGIILLNVLICPMLLGAQNISGHVYEIDSEGKKIALPGANVYWLGTTEGTTSANDGYFSLAVSPKTNQLIVSYIGFQSDTLSVQPGYEVELILKTVRSLEEVKISGDKPSTYFSTLDPLHKQEISGDELKKAACCNLSESFETNASVDVSFSDAISGAKKIKLLGLDGVYSQLLTSNIPNLRGLGVPFGLTYIPGPWMEGISISKGAAAVVDGYESLSGQINADYIKPYNTDPFYINLFANSAGNYEGNLIAGIRAKKIAANLFLHASKNNIPIDHNDDGFVDLPMKENLTVLNTYQVKTDKVKTLFGFKFLTENREGGQTELYNNEDILNLGPLYSIKMNTNRFEAWWKGGYLFERPGTSLAMKNGFSYHDQISIFGLKNYKGKQLNFNTNIIFMTYFDNTNHQLQTGASFVYDSYEELLNDSLYKMTEYVPGVYAQYTYIIPKRFTLQAGARADFNSEFGFLFTPRIHAKYHPGAKNTIRASIGRAFRTAHPFAENINLLASSRKVVLLESVQQEEGWNAGISYTRKFLLGGKSASFIADAFHTRFVNQLVIDLDRSSSAIYLYNLDGKSFSSSYQLEFHYEPISKLDMVIAARYNDVRMTLDGELKEKPMTTKFKGLFNVSYTTPKEGWQFDYTLQLNGRARLPETSDKPLVYQLDEYSPVFTVMNAQISKFFNKLELYAGVENLLNFTQKDPIIAADAPFSNDFDASLVWGPILGRKIYAGLRWSIPYKGKHNDNH